MVRATTERSKEGYHHGNLRVALLASAREMLETQGVGALKLRAITRQVGVSPMAVAPHFGNLRGLLTALATQGFEELAHAIKTGKARSLKDAGLAYIYFAIRNPGLFTLMFRGDAIDRSDPAFAGAAGDSFALLGTWAGTSGNAAGFAPQIAEAVMWGKVHGLAILAIDGLLTPLVQATDPHIDLEQFLEQALDYMKAATSG
ncbi:hypothetical protein HK16_00605 [Acetobacter senegalensis]|uniref:HTH tetR-type domain-containing protein n=2 Tax=Acetobacter TaxID=434 RepID=A0A252ELQ6_9PROT|nr:MULTISPECIES: TetR/AcrR family transcriptional regulator [Acetobacter]ATJ92039.1 TetR/AcrR family transcriptional regulator [Acetobacter tropicalis]OUL67348.1 hypothetical protein HK16_00605 [Acetobacter senegalensis]